MAPVDSLRSPAPCGYIDQGTTCPGHVITITNEGADLEWTWRGDSAMWTLGTTRHGDYKLRCSEGHTTVTDTIEQLPAYLTNVACWP